MVPEVLMSQHSLLYKTFEQATLQSIRIIKKCALYNKMIAENNIEIKKKD